MISDPTIVSDQDQNVYDYNVAAQNDSPVEEEEEQFTEREESFQNEAILNH